jgi:hypothetical protein
MFGAADLRIKLEFLRNHQAYYALAVHLGEIEGNGIVSEKRHSERSCLMISYNCTFVSV